MKMHLLTVVLPIICLAGLAHPPLAAGQALVNAWGKVTFQTPLEFSPPVEIGLDAVSLLHPAGSDLGTATMEITLIAVPKEMQESFGNNDDDVLAYVKTTFLALTDPAEATMRRDFGGKASTGEKHATTFPRPRNLEIYLLPLSDGDKLVVALSRYQGVREEEMGKVASMISATLREAPAK